MQRDADNRPLTPAPPAGERPPGLWKVSVTTVTVFGFGTLVAVAVTLVLVVGLGTATRNTRHLLQDQARSVLDALEMRLDATLQPVQEQARWIARHVTTRTTYPANSVGLDGFMTGALAATPQVTGLGLISARATIHRWNRETGEQVVEDWSDRPTIVEWLRAVKAGDGSRWGRPFWSRTLERTVVIHETPLRRGGEFLGMLAQVVPVEELSGLMAQVQRDTSMVPYVLYDEEQVLAHPLLARARWAAGQGDAPLPRVSELGDTALQQLLRATDTPFMLRGLTDVHTATATIQGTQQVLLQRPVQEHGDGAWTVGVHFDAEEVAGDEPRRLDRAIEVGVVVLLIAIAIAVFVGRRFAHPIQLLALAAEAVRSNELDHVPELPRSRVRELDRALRSFRHMIRGLQERRLMRDVLGRFVPESVARSLLAEGGTLAAEESEATLLFCDIEGFTELTERVGAAGIVALLNHYFEAMVTVLERHGGIVTQFQGDAILATFNVPVAEPEHAARALRAALEMQAVTASRTFAGEPLRCRIGINTGTVVAGAVGARGRLSYTVHGEAVNLAARLEALNKEYATRILVSEYTAAKVEGFPLRRVGETTVRGRTTPVELFELPCSPSDDPCDVP